MVNFQSIEYFVVEERRDLDGDAAVQMDRNGRKDRIGAGQQLGNLGVDLGENTIELNIK